MFNKKIELDSMTLVREYQQLVAQLWRLFDLPTIEVVMFCKRMHVFLRQCGTEPCQKHV